MSRSAPWRRTISDLVSWRQDQALSSTVYIVREVGPTGFHLKEENQDKLIKAFLGDPHRCSCAEFQKDRDLCKHICWLLLKKFRISRQNPVSWQVGLVDREIIEVIRGLTNQTTAKKPAAKPQATSTADGRPVIEQREVTEDDVCPICQDGLLEKKLPVTYCKFGCGNSTHIKCMKVWADHQKSQGEKSIKCPFCREDFGPFDLLKQEDRNAHQRGNRAVSASLCKHFGSTCRGCYATDITGKCYRCTSCIDYHLCQACFNTPLHREHQFQFRQKRNQRWRPAQRPSGYLIPQSIGEDLMNREITENDYDLLSQLDRPQEVSLSNMPAEAVEALPQEKVREGSQLLAPGVQCRMCLQGYHPEQFVRRLPCLHKFHRRCVDPWLTHSQPSCPVCGVVVWSAEMAEAERANIRSTRTKNTKVKPNNSQIVPNEPPLLLEIPGIGIARLPIYHGNAAADSNHHGNGDIVVSNHHSNAVVSNHHGNSSGVDVHHRSNNSITDALNISGDSDVSLHLGSTGGHENGFDIQAMRRASDSGLTLRARHNNLPRRVLPRRRAQTLERAQSTRSLPPSSANQVISEISSLSRTRNAEQVHNTVQPNPQPDVSTLTGLQVGSWRDGVYMGLGSNRICSADPPTRRLGQPRSGIHNHHTTHTRSNALESLFLGNNPQLHPRENGTTHLTNIKSRIRTGPPVRHGPPERFGSANRFGQSNRMDSGDRTRYHSSGQLALDGVNIGP